MGKQILPIEKQQSALLTNDGYLVSIYFCNPLLVKSAANRIEG